jgi:hypothetical protein
MQIGDDIMVKVSQTYGFYDPRYGFLCPFGIKKRSGASAPDRGGNSDLG